MDVTKGPFGVIAPAELLHFGPVCIVVSVDEVDAKDGRLVKDGCSTVRPCLAGICLISSDLMQEILAPVSYKAVLILWIWIGK